MKHLKYKIWNILVMLVVLASCSKKEIELEKRPYTDIFNFKIASSILGVDSLSGVVSGATIQIYWDPTMDKPAQISPIIQIAKGATIKPASGEAVPFSDETQYTVTAEDGTKQIYQLKLIMNVPVPNVSLFKTTSNVVAWGHAVNFSFLNMTIGTKRANHVFVDQDQTSDVVKMYNSLGSTNETVSYPLEAVSESHRVNIEGEYFISGQGSGGKFRVFIKRLKDGFEIETPIETLTENKIVAVFPKYTAELDTGMHQLVFQMNGREFKGPEVKINAPAPAYLKGDFKFHQQGQLLKEGDDIKLSFDNIHDDFDGSITRFYPLSKLTSVEYIFAATAGNNIARGSILRKDLTIEGNTITHKLPLGMITTNNGSAMRLKSISLVFPYVDQRGRNGFVSGHKVFALPEGALVTK